MGKTKSNNFSATTSGRCDREKNGLPQKSGGQLPLISPIRRQNVKGAKKICDILVSFFCVIAAVRLSD